MSVTSNIMAVVTAIKSIRHDVAVAHLQQVLLAVERHLPAGEKWDPVAAVEYVVRRLEREANCLAGERSAAERELATVRTVLAALVPQDQHWRSTTGMAEWLLAQGRKNKQSQRSRK